MSRAAPHRLETGPSTRNCGGRAKGQGIFFRRQRIQELRERYRLEPAPSSTDEWVTHFLRFATSAQMRMSYKPVMLLALLDIVDSDGTVTEDALVRSFLTYYRTRQEAGLVAEGPASALSRPDQVTLSEVRRILMTYPLERFVIKGFLERQPEAGSIRFRQEIWDNLRHGEVLALRRSLQELIARYFASLDDSST